MLIASNSSLEDALMDGPDLPIFAAPHLPAEDAQIVGTVERKGLSSQQLVPHLLKQNGPFEVTAACQEIHSLTKSTKGSASGEAGNTSSKRGELTCVGPFADHDAVQDGMSIEYDKLPAAPV